MTQRMRLVALICIGFTVATVLGSECVDLLDRQSCRLFGGCKWSNEGCRSCLSITSDPLVQYLCTDTCLFDADAGCTGYPQVTHEMTFSPTPSVDADTNVVQGSTTIETGSAGFGATEQAEFEMAMANALGADAVFVEEVETESCGEAPLCGDDPQMVDIVNDWRDLPIPELGQCCAINDTTTTEDCQTNDPSAAHCRYSGVAIPFCDLGTNTPTEQCDSFQNQPALTSFLLNLAFQRDDVEVPCCLSCSCYGDPNCVSFNGTKTSWRLCDGRDTSRKCEITESACKGQKDHMGNSCKWKQQWSAFWKDGSPCQPDVSAEDAWLLMYQADGFQFEIRQEERGVIREVRMVTASGTFSMNADDCISGSDFADTWTYNGTTSNPPSYVESWQRISEPGVFDILWFVFDEATAIQAKIRCTGTPKKGKYGNLRMNIEALVEPMDDYEQQRTDVDGFCATGDLTPPDASSAMTSSYQTHLAIDAVCQNIQVLWNNAEKIEIANLYCGDGQTQNTLVNCWEDTCSRYSFPHTTYSSCIKLFKNDKFDKATCDFVSSLQSARDKCMDDWAEFGHEAVIQNLIDNYNSGVFSDCIDDINDLPTELTSCESGVTLQAQQISGDPDSWTNLFAIPEGIRLCGNELLVLATAAKWTDLFTKPLRFKQCSAPLTCNSVDKCVTESGIDAVFRYDWFAQPVTPVFQPTPHPTTPEPKPTASEKPTFSPTENPSSSPTENPTKSPTDESTPAPTQTPTKWPTKWPSKWPTKWVSTDAPTKNPTTKTPTKNPTKSPTTDSPSRSPSVAPTYCTPECPAPPPTPKLEFRVDQQVCSADIDFDAMDLHSSYCGCDFSQEGAIESIGQQGAQVNLEIACPQMWDDKNQDGLEITCQTICYDLDNDEVKCDTWDLNWETGICSVYTCPTGIPEYVADDCCSSGKPCGIDPIPSAAPGKWRVLEEQAQNTMMIRTVESQENGKVRILKERPATVQEYFLQEKQGKQRRVLSNNPLVLKPTHTIKYFASFTTSNDQRTIVDGVSKSDAFRTTLTSELQQSFNTDDVIAKTLYMTSTYKVLVLEFPQTEYNEVMHTDGYFIQAVCKALQVTINKRSNLNGVRCGQKLFVLDPFGTKADNELRIPVRIRNVQYGKIQSIMETNKGKKTFKQELLRSSNPNVKVLTAHMPDYPDDESGPNVGLIAAISVGCLASVLIGAAFVTYRKRSRLSDEDQLWQIVRYYRDKQQNI